MQKYISQLSQLTHPLQIADTTTWLISDLLRSNSISVYEAYLLNAEILRFNRAGYIQPAWSCNVRISSCLSLLNQTLLATIFREDSAVIHFINWAKEAYHLNREKRDHYILSQFEDFLQTPPSKESLKLLSKVRREYAQLSDDDGPFHVESFPYHFFSPEDILLTNNPFGFTKSITPQIEGLLVALSLKC